MCEECLKCFKTLQNDCYTGYDHFQASFLKPIPEFLIFPMINSYMYGSFLCISPILNKSCLRLFKDYQPVSILPVLWQIY